jgi:hypothetical protein
LKAASNRTEAWAESIPALTNKHPNPGYQEDMSEIANDESRLRATEAQMRRALGLEDGSPQGPQPSPPTPSFVGSHRSPRRFVRDGEVPVSIIHSDDTSGTHQLETARQTIRSLTAAKEHAERSLEEAQVTIRHLQTEVAHERLAKDEAAHHAESEREAIEQTLKLAQAALVVERTARQQAEECLAEALKGRREAEELLRQSSAARTAPKPAKPAARRTSAVKSKARRSSPASEEDSDVIEWWVPGWKERLR